MRASVNADFMMVRNFSKDQRYLSIGQTIRGEWKSPAMRVPVYAWISYTNRGRFNNALEAIAKDPGTLPQSIAYTNRGRMRHTQVSVGVKPYLKGGWEAEEGWNIYGIAGLGLLMGRVDNEHSIAIDTASYALPVRAGTKRFNRLTVDLGLGLEWPMGGDLFLYTEGKTYIPVSTYPSDFLVNSRYNPLTAYLAIGVRVLF